MSLFEAFPLDFNFGINHQSPFDLQSFLHFRHGDVSETEQPVRIGHTKREAREFAIADNGFGQVVAFLLMRR